MDFADEEEDHLIIRPNGGRAKCSDELKLTMQEGLTLKEVVRSANKRFNKPDNVGPSKLYNKNGVLLFDSDFSLIQSGEVLYIGLQGESFNYCAILDDYELGRKLGEGGFGKVMLGIHRDTKAQVAIKYMDIGSELGSANMIQGIYKEAEALKALQHKNIVKLFHGFIDGKRFVMIMEAAMGGQLLDYLRDHKVFPETVAREIVLQVVQAMLYCHSRGVIHRDLKLENVIFKNKGDKDRDEFFIKVIDFGIAGVEQDKVDSGTLAYMSPECLDGDRKTSAAIDVWAIGIMFYTLVYGELPFYGNTERELIKKIINDPIKFNNKYPISQMGKDVIKQMLQKDPTKRIELITFVQSEYNTLDDDEFEQIYQKTVAEFEVNKEKIKKEEEMKEQEKILEKFNNQKQDDNLNLKRKEYHPPSMGGVSPRHDKKTKDGKPKKKKVSKN